MMCGAFGALAASLKVADKGRPGTVGGSEVRRRLPTRGRFSTSILASAGLGVFLILATVALAACGANQVGDRSETFEQPHREPAEPNKHQR